MTMTEFENIESNFVGNFRVGDNLVYNSQVLCDLVCANEDGRFDKPIIVQAAALVEGCMSEIIFRAQNYNREGVETVSEEERREIESKKLDKFSPMIDVFKKYGFLDELGEDIYPQLHRLRMYRNKVHIQDDIKMEGASQREERDFNADVRDWALQMTHAVILHLSLKFPRPKYVNGHVASMRLPLPQ